MLILIKDKMWQGRFKMIFDNSRVARIFEYLLAVKNINEKIYRDVNEYEKIWWESTFPQMEGCYVGGNGTNEDAWLEVHKQEIPAYPAIPKELHKWVTKWDNPDRFPTNSKSLIIGLDDDGNEIIELFEEDDDRVAQYNDWIEVKWKRWSKEASPKQKIQNLYMELFSLYQRFQREGEDLEIAWGHGLLQWSVSDYKINRHILVTKLELVFEPKKGIFYLIPTSKGTSMETDMLLNVDFPNSTRLHQMENQLSEMDFSPLELETIKPFLQEVVHTVSPEGKYKEINDYQTSFVKPVISYSPGIFIRNTGGRLWQNELTKAINKIKEGFPVPKPVTVLTTTEENQNDDDKFTETPDNNSSWSAVGEDLLFPLPTNKEQQFIAQKLSTQNGVVVQGPPGTGKSHTIANLICHLLAHGKRVLVTSEKHRALQVLRDKVPEEIRALCVSVLGGDSKSVKEIEDSVKQIAENLDSKQPEILDKNIERLQSELKSAKRKIAHINTLINQAADAENSSCTFGKYSFSPLEASKWLSENIKHSWLPDKVSPQIAFPLSNEELHRFFELIGILDKCDVISLTLNRPDINRLASPTEFSEKVEDYKSIDERVKKTQHYINNWRHLENLELDFKYWINELKQLKEKLLELNRNNWLYTILQDCTKDKDRKSFWEDFIASIENEINMIQDLDKQLLEHEINLPKGINLIALKEDLNVIKAKLEKNKGIGWLFKNILGRKYKYIFEDITVNDLPIQKYNDVEIVLNNIDLILTKRKLVLKWNRVLEEIEGIKLDENEKRFSLYVKDQIALMKKAVFWYEETQRMLDHLIKNVGMDRSPRYDSIDMYEDLINGLEALQNKRIWSQTNSFFDELHVYLRKGKDQASSHPIWSKFYEMLDNKNVLAWEELFLELVRLEGQLSDFEEFTKFENRCKKLVPIWTNAILDKGGIGKPLMPPEDIHEAWTWKQVDTWIKDLHSKPKIEELEEELKIEKRREHQIIKELVAEAAWREQIARTTNTQKRSLFAWLKAVQRIGKGTGKYANVYRREASNEMKIARGAIPVWIMPIQRVIENFDLASDLFDVIIIDESSQSNLFSLSVLLRAKKAVIVGDENQISPENSFTDIGDIHKLIDRYLYDIPNAKQFDIRTSIYDTANRVFDSKISLKEHYRCVPEIIQFSNDLMYGGTIDPLRLPLASEVLSPPVLARRVTDGYRKEGTSKAINEPEAEAIVSFIKNCLQDSRYNNKSFGVISLQGHDQARIIENLLREEIGEEEMINRQLICGDSYSFQGDERDVIVLSMVIAPNVRFNALGKRADLQRFNVAASRAKDQMILFHSIDLKDLSSKDVRYNLLQYCLDPKRVQAKIEDYLHEFDSNFEKDVFRLITARGYRVIPQVKVGTLGKKIDLVVEGMRTRLAVECDGDRWHGLDKWEEDMERQRVLERVGWTFWRVRGSAFYLDPERAMESLWRKLDQMGINPHLEDEISEEVIEEQLELFDNKDKEHEPKKNSKPKEKYVQLSLEDYF